MSVLALTPCGGCGVAQRYELFPSYAAPPPPSRPGETLLSDEEAACAFHAKKRADSACQRCGLFVCALCALDVNGERICPRCLETGVKKGKLTDLESHRFLYDRLALLLVTYPLLIFYFTLVTAPISLFVAIRWWNAPRSIVRPGRRTQIAAVVLASLELLGWAALIVVLVAAFARRKP